MFLVIDNYDSFVHNLARYFELCGAETKIMRNDKLTVKEIEEMSPEAIILSPGPCTPKEAGICIEVVKKLGANIPILGVCLGHQAIGEAYNAPASKSGAPIHGKASQILHKSEGIFEDLPSPMRAGRYHSLKIKPQKNSALHVTAYTNDGEIMAVQHKTHPVYGVQFHPESAMTEHGMALIENFVQIVRSKKQQDKAA